MIMNKRYLTWSEFDLAIERMGAIYLEAYRTRLKGPRDGGIYGEPRGGLPLAVALSHLLDLPLLMNIPLNGKALWVDDIFDSNRSWEVARVKGEEYGTELLPMAWFSRYDPPDQGLYVERIDSDIWLVFPWERWSDPDTEIERYQRSERRVI